MTRGATTLATVALWLATKDPEEGYHYSSRRHCACGQWLVHLGLTYLCDPRRNSGFCKMPLTH